jgi:hypothetical protein
MCVASVFSYYFFFLYGVYGCLVLGDVSMMQLILCFSCLFQITMFHNKQPANATQPT